MHLFPIISEAHAVISISTNRLPQKKPFMEKPLETLQ